MVPFVFSSLEPVVLGLLAPIAGGSPTLSLPVRLCMHIYSSCLNYHIAISSRNWQASENTGWGALACPTFV